MSIVIPAPVQSPAKDMPPSKAPVRRRRRGSAAVSSMLAQGEPMIWLTGGALAVCLVMITSLVALVFWFGLETFWPMTIVQVKTVAGKTYLGEVTRTETYQPTDDASAALPESERRKAKAAIVANGGNARRRLVRTGNYELTGSHFQWISDFEIAEETAPDWVVVLERMEWGRFYGIPKEFRLDDQPVAANPEEIWTKFEEHHGASRKRFAERRKLEAKDTGEANKIQEDARLAMKQALLDHGAASPEYDDARRAAAAAEEQCGQEFARIRRQIDELNQENNRYQLVLATSDGQEKAIALADVVRAYPANRLSLGERVGVYLSRWWEFLVGEPREANSEGGVFPAIWGTVVMTLIMSLAVVPFGVLAALYLREYAQAGPVVSAVRISINNLAGVPSIVFGVFGLGFFCYIIGAYLDGGPKNIGNEPWLSATWLAWLAVTAMAGVGAFFSGMACLAVRPGERTWLRKSLGWLSMALWIGSVALLIVLLAFVPRSLFSGFYEATLPNPTYGKGGLLWSSLTLSLLTLPVVIVATEEALSSVPNSMREGSYACGASKWQTIARVVLPRAMPGIMTGMILAMARGAGEVAPLMLVGAVKLAPELPVDLTFPFVHPDRSFMHLGFHIYDLGFQSQNSEAAKPMVYTTTMLLILIVAGLNFAAVFLRGRLSRRFIGGHF